MSGTTTRLLAREQPHHLRAFEHYYALGEKRSYERVATEFSVATSTVKLWARSFGWQDRIRERDLEIARDVAGRTMSDKLIRLEAFLSDEPESRHELVLSSLAGKSDIELREIVKQELETLRQIADGSPLD